jgi:hypothetical protein
MRVWDAGATGAGERLSQVQGTLDALCRTTPADQPVFVRDARWLIPLAQSPTTDSLAGYFEVLEHIDGSLSEADRLEIHKAAVQLAGGHLRSPWRRGQARLGERLAQAAAYRCGRPTAVRLSPAAPELGETC